MILVLFFYFTVGPIKGEHFMRNPGFVHFDDHEDDYIVIDHDYEVNVDIILIRDNVANI